MAAGLHDRRPVAFPRTAYRRFLECQRGLTAAAEGFPGYQGTELYPPAETGIRSGWRSSTSTTNESLQRWIDSPVRADWIKKLRDEIGDFQLKTLPSGFGAWFAGLEMGPEGEPPPSWKIAMTVLARALSHRHGARPARRAIPELPGNGACRC